MSEIEIIQSNPKKYAAREICPILFLLSFIPSLEHFISENRILLKTSRLILSGDDVLDVPAG